MDPSVLITVVVAGAVLILGAVSVVIASKRQNARKAASPSRHRGEFQSQKGRVYTKGATDHNAAPTSPS
jgi:hypothetical protein